MFQGGRDADEKNRRVEHIRLSEIDAVLVTRADLVHTGRLPLVVKAGYTGPIISTKATIELAELVMKDSVHIQEMHVERQNEYNERSDHLR